MDRYIRMTIPQLLLYLIGCYMTGKIVTETLVKIIEYIVNKRLSKT